MFPIPEKMSYAEVIVPLPLENTYTYRIPAEMEPFVRVHCLVTVPFGKKRHYTAIVKAIHDHLPDSSFECKNIEAVLDENPVIYPLQMQFWDWIASYYLCKTGDVYKAAVPPGLLNKDQKKRFSPQKETFIRLTAAYGREEAMATAFGNLQRAKQQEQLLLTYVDLARPFCQGQTREVSKKELLKKSGTNTTALAGLIHRGILEAYEKETGRIQPTVGDCLALNALTEAQQTAFDGIQAVFRTKSVCLLHGVASCGKTEIYIRLIRETLQQGSHVLYLLPEIAITKRVTARLTRIFGDRLLVYHSGFSDHKRVEVWNRLLHANESMVVAGVRSSVFLPFAHLGLVIVDEEHDASYRQQDPAPRYHARNAAIMLAHSHGARTLLGSATPSLESYYNAKSEKYGLVTLNVRHENTPDPLISLIDVKELKRKKIMKETLFSPLLKASMEEALKRNEQVVLFQNRRGFAMVMECKSCGHVVRCIDCDVSLTCHKKLNRLVCHYCGYSVPFPSFCPSCRGNEMKLAGFGTERVEEEIAALFPDVPANRLDLDTARTRSAFERILAGFEKGESKILVGTQMLTKGLDCKQVGVVGVLNVDNLMNVPDFRAHERAFQLMMQVISCAGQRHRRGTVVIQTSQPDHPLIQAIRTFDYERMAYAQLSERKMFRYPPYYRLIVLVLRCNDEHILEQISTRYVETLHEKLGEQVLPPFTPPLNRVQTLFVRHIMLKLETSLPVVQARSILEYANRKMQSFPEFKQVILHYEVDN